MSQAEERLRQIADAIRKIVITEGEDAGVILLSWESPVHYDPELKCHVYEHENFSPLGDALVKLARLTQDALTDSHGITEAERLEFAAAEWTESLGFPQGFMASDERCVATKDGPNGWWRVSRTDGTAAATLETAAECIRWAHDPDSVEPGIIGWREAGLPSYHCGD